MALSNTTLGTLMSSLDSNIVLIALPTIARNLPHTSLLELLWVLLGYQLVTASVLVNFGRLADMFGRVKLYNLGFAVFTAGSALCSAAQSGDQLVAFRMVQAVGSAFLFSNSAAILTDAFPPGERGRALGVNQVAIVVGSVTGLVLGGVLTTAAGWRSIFWVNIPIGVFATLWAHFRLKELGEIRESQRIDLVGNVVFAGGLASMLTGITLYALSAITGRVAIFLLTLGGCLLALFIYVEGRVKHPMFDLSIFKIRMFAAGNAAILLNSLARGAASLVLVIYLQGPTMELSPLQAGIYLTPISASLALFGPISGYLSDKYGPRWIATLGLLVSCAGFILLTFLGTHITFTGLLVPLVLIGSGMGIFASPNRASIMNAAPPAKRGLAAGTSTTLTNAGNTFSLGLAFLILTSSTSTKNLEQIFLGSSNLGDAPWIPQFISSIHRVFLVSSAILLLAIIPSILRGQKNS
ncbi:MAG: MFS transporter [Thermoprotei archaeon]